MEAIRELSALRAQMTQINGLPDGISNVNWQQIDADLLCLTEFKDLEALSAQRLCVVLRKEHAVVEYAASEVARNASSDSGSTRRNKNKLKLTDVIQHNIHAELGSLLSDLFGNPPPLDDLMNRVLNGPGSDDILQHLVERVVDLDERRTVVLLKFVLSTAEQTRHTHLSGHRKKVVKEEPSADLDQLRLDFTDLTSRARSQERSHSEDLIKIQAAHQASHRETVALYESKMELMQPDSGRPDARASVLHARCLLLQSEVDALRDTQLEWTPPEVMKTIREKLRQSNQQLTDLRDDPDFAPGIAVEVRTLGLKLTESRATLETLQDRNQELERMSTAANNKYTGLSFQLQDKVEELAIVRAKLSREKGEGERMETALRELNATLDRETASYNALSNDLEVSSDLCIRTEEERDILLLRIQEELYTQEALNKQVLELEQSLHDQHQEVVDLETSHQLAAAAQADLQRQPELLRSQLVTVEAMYQQANSNTVRVTVERDELASLEVLRSTPSRSFVTPTTPGKQTDFLPSPNKPPVGFLSRVGNVARRANKDAGSSYGHRATTGPTPSSPAYRSTNGPGPSASNHLPPQPSRSNPYAPTTTNECYWDNASFWLVSSDPQQPDDNFVSALLIGTDVNGVLVAMSFDHEAQPGDTEWNLAPVSQLIQEQTAYDCELRLVTLKHACALDHDSDQGFMEEYASGLHQMMANISTVD